jgi:hypothetical protein
LENEKIINNIKTTLDLLIMKLYYEEKIKENKDIELIKWYQKQISTHLKIIYEKSPDIFKDYFNPKINIKNKSYSYSYYKLYNQIK